MTGVTAVPMEVSQLGQSVESSSGWATVTVMLTGGPPGTAIGTLAVGRGEGVGVEVAVGVGVGGSKA